MKYIIEFEDEYSMNEGGMKYHQCKQVPYWSVSHGIIKNLTPYTEPDRNAIEDEVWEFVRCVHKMNGDDYHECFDIADVSDEDYCTKYSYQEARAKYEAWMKQKDEIHVGDEITYIFNNNTKTEPFVVVFIRETENGKYYEGIESCGNRWVAGGVKYQKTGRHFPEVAELLEKMRGDKE